MALTDEERFERVHYPKEPIYFIYGIDYETVYKQDKGRWMWTGKRWIPTERYVSRSNPDMWEITEERALKIAGVDHF